MRSGSPSMAYSRKRPRITSHHFTTSAQTPRANTSSFDLGASISSLDCASPAPLAATEYFLSGGMDTPGAWREQRLEQAQEFDAEADYRCSRFSQKQRQISFGDAEAISTSFGGQQDRTSTLDSNNSWGLKRTAWALTGGLAGKIFNFCWSTTFKGFQAGGGQAYTSNGSSIPGAFPGSRKASANHEQSRPRRPSATPVQYSYSRGTTEHSATKDSWVFLEHNTISQDDQSPVRKRSRASVAGSYSTVQPVQPPTKSHTASFASPRSRTASSTSIHTRPASSGKSHRPSASAVSAASPRRQASYFSQQSPVSPEVEAFQRKKRKEERRNDQSLKRLNSQLQDMIREGQQALGSKIEIVGGDADPDIDEGYYDDEVR